MKVEVLARHEKLSSADKIDRVGESRPSRLGQGVLVCTLMEPRIVF